MTLERFNFLKNALISEASDLGSDFRPQLIYDDACDEGIAIRSHHTNRNLLYDMIVSWSVNQGRS